MEKAFAYLMCQADAPTATRAFKLFIEEQQEAVLTLVGDHEKDIARKNTQIAEITQERDFFKSQFEQATGWEDPDKDY